MENTLISHSTSVPNQAVLDRKLYQSIGTSDHEIIKNLLDQKANPHTKYACGSYPLHEAARKCDKVAIELLIESKANIYSK